MTIAETIQDIGFLTEIRESALVYPIIMSTHLACIAVFGGMILMTDLRLLGVTMTGRSVTDVVNQFRVWKRVGFCIMIAMGLLLILLIVGLPTLILIGVLRANRPPKRRPADQEADEGAQSG